MDFNRKNFFVAAMCAVVISACSSQTDSGKLEVLKEKNKQVVANLPEGCTLTFAGDYYPKPETAEYYTQSVLVVSCMNKQATTMNTSERCGKSTCPKTNVVINDSIQPNERKTKALKLELPNNATLIENNRDERRRLIQNLLNELQKMDSEAKDTK